MKAAGHPQYFQATVTCACGNTFVVGSTKSTIQVEICAKCHPFFTGEMKFIDTLGRVEKFKQRQAAATGYVGKKKQADDQKAAAKTLKEMLEEAKTKA